MPKSHTSNIDKNYINKSYIEVSQSVPMQKQQSFEKNGQIDTTQEENILDEILEQCELWVLPDEVKEVFQNAIERLFYSSHLKVDDAILPKKRIRAHLWKIDGMVLQEAHSKLLANRNTVKNSTAYLMVTLINAIHELQSDLLLDPFLNSLNVKPNTNPSLKSKLKALSVFNFTKKSATKPISKAFTADFLDAF